MNLVFFVPYAYDRMPYGEARRGIPADRLGSKARCDALLAEYKNSGLKKCISSFVLTAGFTKDSPDEPTETVTESLASQMERYVRLHGHYHPLIPRRLVWGTYEETAAAIGAISEIVRTWELGHEDVRSDPDDQVHVFVSTNPGHMPRVKLCWRFLKPRGWCVHFVPANHTFTKKEWGQETVKFFQYLYRFLFRRW